jgi:hypothetical protein
MRGCHCNEIPAVLLGLRIALPTRILGRGADETAVAR